MASPNLGITHIQAAQNQKEVTANAAFDNLDLAMTNFISEVMSGNTLTLPVIDATGNLVFHFTGALTATGIVTLPSSKKLYVVSNQTNRSLLFQTAGAGRSAFVGDSGVASIPAYTYTILYCDGTNVDIVAAPSVNPEYLVSTLPTGTEGQRSYALNGRKVGESAGHGTGVPVYYSQGSWRVFSTDAAVTA